MIEINFHLKHYSGNLYKTKTVYADPTTTGEYRDVQDLITLKVGQEILVQLEDTSCHDAVITNRRITEFKGETLIEYDLKFVKSGWE